MGNYKEEIASLNKVIRSGSPSSKEMVYLRNEKSRLEREQKELEREQRKSDADNLNKSIVDFFTNHPDGFDVGQVDSKFHQEESGTDDELPDDDYDDFLIAEGDVDSNPESRSFKIVHRKTGAEFVVDYPFIRLNDFSCVIGIVGRAPAIKSPGGSHYLEMTSEDGWCDKLFEIFWEIIGKNRISSEYKIKLFEEEIREEKAELEKLVVSEDKIRKILGIGDRITYEQQIGIDKIHES